MMKRLTSLAVAAVIGTALFAAPAQARFGGGWGGGGFRVGGFGGGFARGPGFGGGFVRGPGFGGGFIGRPGFGRAAFFPGRRFAFFPGRRFGAPFFGAAAFGLGAFAASSCWTWVPTSFGWRRVWACSSGWDSDWDGGWGGGWGGSWGGGWGGVGWSSGPY
jgi:hypothetical protein